MEDVLLLLSKVSFSILTLDPTPFYYCMLFLPFLILSFSPWTISISRMCSGVLWCIMEFFDSTSLSTCFLIFIGFYSKFWKELPVVNLYIFISHSFVSILHLCFLPYSSLKLLLLESTNYLLCCQVHCLLFLFYLKLTISSTLGFILSFLFPQLCFSFFFKLKLFILYRGIAD